MNRKFEDKLAELAFGDLSPEEAARLERDAAGDREAQRTLSMYRDMKVGLKSLADVPEDQFSKERLRDAILTQGLKPVAPRPTSNRAWLWMPCAALLIGFGYTVVKQNMRQNVMPEIVMGPASIKGTPLVNTPAPSLRVAENETPPTAGLLHRGTTSDRHSDRSHVADENSTPVMAKDFNGENGEDPGYFDPAAYNDGVSGTTVSNPLTPPSRLGRGAPTGHEPEHAANSSAAHSGPVILINQVKNQQTGAEDAQEVSSVSNVLVSG